MRPVQAPTFDVAGPDREAVGEDKWIGMPFPSWVIQLNNAAPFISMRRHFANRDALDEADHLLAVGSDSRPVTLCRLQGAIEERWIFASRCGLDNRFGFMGHDMHLDMHLAFGHRRAETTTASEACDRHPLPGAAKSGENGARGGAIGKLSPPTSAFGT